MRQRSQFLLTALAVAVGVLTLAAPARATFPGTNGPIAFVRGPDVYTMKPDGSGVRQLTSLGPDGSAFFESWSPDGRQLVFNEFLPDQPPQLWVMNADGSDQHLLLNDPGYADFAPRFSPDGSTVIFARCPPFANCAIYRVGSDGSGLTAITSFDPAVFDFHPGYSPDGTTIAFSSFSREGVISAVWLMNADGSNIRRLSPPELGACCPDWSPDGSKVAFMSSNDPQNAEIWVINRNGTGLTQLTDTIKLHDRDPSWAPEGNAIAFQRDVPPSRTSGIYVMRSDGSRPRLIQRDAQLPRWGAAF